MSIRHRTLRPVGPLLAVLILALAGCERTLVYGERSGFNVGIWVTPSENLPLEVNAGLKRRVVGIIPPSGERRDGQVNGEAVNMFSRFDVQYQPSTEGVLFGTHTVSTAFASGGAATAIANSENAERLVAAIVRPEVITLDTSAEAGRVRKALTSYIKGSEERVSEYLKLATERGLAIDDDIPTPLAALSAIARPTNASKNAEIADQLGLLN
jgi:hypothetical protein